MSRIPRLAGAIAGALLVSGAAVAITAHAAGLSVAPQAASPSPSPSSKAGQNRQADCQAFVGYFAKNLNTSPDKVAKAYQGALASTLADAVKSGQITQAQADKIKAATASAEPCQGLAGISPKGGPGGPGGRGPMAAMDVPAAIAKALGVSADQLKTDFQNGQTVQKIAAAGNISEAAFESSVVASLTANLDTALKDGKISQAQHDAMVQRLPETAKAFWSSDRPGVAGHGGPGAPHGPKPTPTPSAT